MRLYITTVMNIKMKGCMLVTLCCLVSRYKCFQTCCTYLQGTK